MHQENKWVTVFTEDSVVCIVFKCKSLDINKWTSTEINGFLQLYLEYVKYTTL